MGLEIEVALGRDGGYDARAVFRRGARVTVGSRPSALLSCTGAGVPDLLEVVTFNGTAPSLRFLDGMNVEVNLGGALRDAASLIAAGLVVREDEHWLLGLDLGARAVVGLGESRLLIKVGPERKVAIWDVGAESDACGGCGTEVPWAVRGGGALSPCPKCRELNRFAPRTGSFEQQATASLNDVPRIDAPLQASEIRPTEPMPVIDARAAVAAIGPASLGPNKNADPPTHDAIEAQKAADPPTFDAIEVARQSDLPTHDAIAVQKAGNLPTFDGIAVQKAAALPTHDGLRVPANPDATPARGADLPTFDSITAFKAEQAVSTLDAMVALRQDTAEADVRQGPTLDVSRAAREAREEIPTGMNLAPMNPADLSDGMTRQVPVQLQPSALDPAPALEPPPADTAPARAPVAGPVPEPPPRKRRGEISAVRPPTTRKVPIDDTASDLPKVDEYVDTAQHASLPGAAAPQVAKAAKAAKAAPPAPAPRAPKPPVPPTKPQSPAVTDDDEYDGYDDFLMGRDDGGITSPAGSGWGLILLGLVAGAMGVGLLVYALVS